jgi:hypothetical protein
MGDANHPRQGEYLVLILLNNNKSRDESIQVVIHLCMEAI